MLMSQRERTKEQQQANSRCNLFSHFPILTVWHQSNNKSLKWSSHFSDTHRKDRVHARFMMPIRPHHRHRIISQFKFRSFTCFTTTFAKIFQIITNIADSYYQCKPSRWVVNYYELWVIFYSIKRLVSFDHCNPSVLWFMHYALFKLLSSVLCCIQILASTIATTLSKTY